MSDSGSRSRTHVFDFFFSAESPLSKRQVQADRDRNDLATQAGDFVIELLSLNRTDPQYPKKERR